MDQYRTKRIERIFHCARELGEEKLDAVVFANAVEPHIDMGFFYITGLAEGVFENSAAIAFSDGSAALVTSILEESTAKKSGMDLFINDGSAEWEKNMKKALGRSKRVGFNSHEMTYSTYQSLKKTLPKVSFVDISGAVQQARLVKDKIEIEHTKEACRIASIAAEKIVEKLCAGVKEYEIAAELTYMMQKEGASGNSFNSISSFGANTAEPHYLAGNAVARKKETVLLDFGCTYKRYVSDITRTYFIGKADKNQRKMYETVQQAQHIGLDAIGPGVDGAKVDRLVRDFIDRGEFKGKFIHSTGHSIGLSVHDGGTLNHKKELILEPGMIFTVEPGVYIPGKYGVRIEDDVLVTKKGMEVLTTAPKALLQI